jgi:hypothetical protein
VKQLNWHIDKGVQFTKSIYPEVWVTEEWPALRIGDSEPGVRDFTHEKISKITLETIMKPA